MKKLVIALAVVLAAGVASADTALIDYQGYSYETGGFPASNVGDVLTILGIADGIDSRFGINLLNEEVTLYAHNLVSTGQVDVGGGVLQVAYSGGDIEVWRDPSRDHDFGTNPPNASAPSSFVNGTLFLSGTLSSFFLYFEPTTGSGAYDASAFFTGGSGIATLTQINPNGYTFGGVLSRAAVGGGNIPAGYDLQVDGTLQVDVITSVEQRSWGAVKSLYSR